jgi:agmatine deiminase
MNEQLPDKFPVYRLPAEWEPQSAVQLTFPHAGTDWADVLDEVLPCFVEIAETISRHQKVLVVCRDPEQTRRLLSRAAPENLLCMAADSNDTWARDHGGIAVEVLKRRNAPKLRDGDQWLILDFVFNGWGLKFPADKDNGITRALCNKGVFRAKLRPGGLVLEGGGLESDGQGTLLTTAECLLSLNRNPHLSKSQLERQLKNRFGLDRILWLHHGYLAGDDTDSHIDTLARFCDPETIAYVRCDDPTDEHRPALLEMEKELKSFRTAAGRPYRLVPLPWPDACFAEDGHRLPATYANFLIINGAVLVPTYRVRQDAEALAVFKNLFPDRAVIGIDCRMLIEQHGSLHCVTMQYPEGVVRE